MTDIVMITITTTITIITMIGTIEDDKPSITSINKNCDKTRNL